MLPFKATRRDIALRENQTTRVSGRELSLGRPTFGRMDHDAARVIHSTAQRRLHSIPVARSNVFRVAVEQTARAAVATEVCQGCVSGKFPRTKQRSKKPRSAGRALLMQLAGTIWHRRPRAKEIRRYPAESSFAFERLQYVFRQGSIEVVRHGKLALCQTNRTQLGKWRRIQDGEQAGRFLRQGLSAFRRNAPVVNFDFKRQITHGMKLHRDSHGRKKRLTRRD